MEFDKHIFQGLESPGILSRSWKFMESHGKCQLLVYHFSMLCNLCYCTFEK